jgi:IS30 family transposase
MNYTHLTKDERYRIYILKQAGHSQDAIAVLLNRHSSTISRELYCNHGQRGYRAKQAQGMADARARNCRNARRITPETWEAFDAAGRLRKH